jgi:DNA-directed RNA polymerase subunit RPC12/RpoP
MSRKDKPPKCTFHPDIAAVGKCANCGRPFCNICLEETKKKPGKRCLECLSAGDLRQRVSLMKNSTLYIASAACFVLLVLSALGFMTNQSPSSTLLEEVVSGPAWWITVSVSLQSQSPQTIIYEALIAGTAFTIWSAYSTRGVLRLRRNLPEHGFCPKCGSVLFGKGACPNCGKEILVSSPAYPDILWLRQYLRMKEKAVVDYEEELEKRKKLLRTKYRGRRTRLARPEE